MKRGLNFAASKFLDYLESCSKPITRKDELFNLAMITTNNHQEISMIISEALITLGINGIINIEESNYGINQLIVKKELNKVIGGNVSGQWLCNKRFP
jgi:chaperonin GroEL (HSP60 family)